MPLSLLSPSTRVVVFPVPARASTIRWGAVSVVLDCLSRSANPFPFDFTGIGSPGPASSFGCCPIWVSRWAVLIRTTRPVDSFTASQPPCRDSASILTVTRFPLTLARYRPPICTSLFFTTGSPSLLG